ncbi:O-methyltransferas-like protein family 3 [Mytilinidion resinicola]|uniref:O-methyltransferas-like protein family 3 n=1 Tax=Mytilinidion resinicola TaxID=574789 RepID=A0A6A6Y679_9PEZI|nr:O-methyltransferas-like protein family 3 [Mytilinidion resinicola]KAF2804312.1 O-methyltransferas-like protein family 3 [Mytilinidion resinicola]
MAGHQGPYDPQIHERDPRWTAIDKYATSHLHNSIPSEASLTATLINSSTNGLPDIAVSPSQGKHLMLTARLISAQRILEVGTLGGYSTLWLANATPTTRVTSVEISPKHAAVARESLQKAGVGERTEVLVGAGLDILPKLAAEVHSGKREKFDLVFIDADKENNWAYADIAAGISRSGACLVVDNVVRRGELANDKTEDSRVLGSRRVVENVGKDPRLDATVLQTVGEKSYDGFLFAVVK